MRLYQILKQFLSGILVEMPTHGANALFRLDIMPWVIFVCHLIQLEKSDHYTDPP